MALKVHSKLDIPAGKSKFNQMSSMSSFADDMSVQEKQRKLEEKKKELEELRASFKSKASSIKSTKSLGKAKRTLTSSSSINKEYKISITPVILESSDISPKEKKTIPKRQLTGHPKLVRKNNDFQQNEAHEEDESKFPSNKLNEPEMVTKSSYRVNGQIDEESGEEDQLSSNIQRIFTNQNKDDNFRNLQDKSSDLDEDDISEFDDLPLDTEEMPITASSVKDGRDGLDDHVVVVNPSRKNKFKG